MTARSSPWRRRWLGLALGLGVPVAALAVLELGLRVGGFEHPVEPRPYEFRNDARRHAESGKGFVIPDPVLFWRLRPGGVSKSGASSIGVSGWRTPPFDEEPSGRRVLCLGDSTTFGLGVGDAFPWPRQLERLLRSRAGGETVEVLNFGVPGYSSHQGLELLRSEGLPLSPDVVVLAFGAFNDWVPAVERPDDRQGEPPGWAALRVGQLMVRVFGQPPAPDPAFRYEPGPGETLGELRTRGYDGIRRVPPESFERNLRAMARLTASSGARVVFVAQPLPAHMAERNPAALRYAETIRAVAQELDCPVADGWQVFRQASPDGNDLFLDFCHPTIHGHRLLARAVDAALQQ